MDAVRNIVEKMPSEGLLRKQAWRGLEPLVRLELQRYADSLGVSIKQALDEAEPGMESAAIRQAPLPDGMRRAMAAAPPAVATTTELILKTQINTNTLGKLFDLDRPGEASPVARAMFKNVEKIVTKGIIDGTPTDEIAAALAKRTKRAGIPGIDLNSKGAAKQIRSMAMAMSRTAIQDFNQQVKERVYQGFDEALEGMVWEHSSALDSRVCPTCMALDEEKWLPGDGDRPRLPIHVGCRCAQVLIDPKDPYFWDNESITAQQIRPEEDGPYAGGYKTPIVINGKTFYRKAVQVTSDTPPPRYADVLAYWAKKAEQALMKQLVLNGPRSLSVSWTG